MLPNEYQWLLRRELQPLPRMIQEALKLFGTHEVGGPGNNSTILAWASEVGLRAVYTADSIPWCGLFMAVVAQRAGKVLPPTPLWALGWAKFGEKAGQPRLGDVLVFVRQGGGHVSLYIGEDSEAYHVLGGNQSDRVCFTRIAKGRLYTAQRPRMNAPPLSMKPYILSASGALSTNEA